MTSEEQKTWDFLTWVHNVNESSLRLDQDYHWGHPQIENAKIIYMEFKDGTELTKEQIERYCIYFPKLITEAALDEIFYSGN